MPHKDRKRALEYNKEYRAKNPEKHKEYARNATIRHKEQRRQYAVDNRDRLNASRRLYKSTPRGYFVFKLSILRRTKRTKLPMDLTVLQMLALYAKQDGRCALTGRLLCLKREGKLDSLSIDRKNPRKGYTIKNVRFVTWQANTARHTGTDFQLVAFCRDVLKYAKRRQHK